MNQILTLSRGNFSRRARPPILLVIVPIAIVCLVTVRVIPPVTGRVVNAVTGEPIRNVRLTLEMNHYEGFSVHTELHDAGKSGILGWFFLSGALRWRGILLESFQSYWLTVNEGTQISGQEETSAATQAIYNPMFDRRGVEVGDRSVTATGRIPVLLLRKIPDNRAVSHRRSAARLRSQMRGSSTRSAC